MEKKGFTLVELLVTLVVIAIAAAIITPKYIAIKPDRHKFKVLNVYNSINNLTEKLITNPAFYYKKDPSTATSSDFDSNGNLTGQFVCTGLSCTLEPLAITGYNSQQNSGICKFPNLIANLAALENVTECVNTGTSHKMSGTISDSIYIEIESTSGTPTYRMTLDVDQSSGGGNCTYSSSACHDPDRFTFLVDKFGNISGEDSLTKTYLRNITNTNKSLDYQNASQ